MEQLLNSLLVRKPDGTLAPVSSSQGEHVDIERPQPPRSLQTAPAPKAQASLKRKASFTMDAVHSMAECTPPPSAQVDRSPVLGGGDGYAGLQSMDDFEKENPWTPKQKLIPVKATKVNPESSIRFNNLCVKHFIVPDFTYDMPAETCFSVTVQFGDMSAEAIGPYSSKKHAKEAVSKVALPQMEAFHDKESKKKRKGSEALQSPSSRTSAAVLNSENFIGLLQNHAQAHGHRLPDYSESRTVTTPIQFACTVRIAEGPLTLFGSETELYPSKPEAKKAAARDAVTWLRDQGKMATPVKCQRTVEDAPLLPEQTGLTQLVADINVEAPDPTSLPQRVHELVVSLGFSQPSFDSHPSLPPGGEFAKSSGAFVDMAANFSAKDVEKDPRLAGPIGKVEHVHGKKTAREMVCRELLPLLEEIKASTLG